MSRLSESEKQALLAACDKDMEGPPLRDDERFVPPSPEGRARYIDFATQAARFYRGRKPVGFKGECWKL